jgi:hypothetical protein
VGALAYFSRAPQHNSLPVVSPDIAVNVEEAMDYLPEYEALIIKVGLFLVFLVTFGEYVFKKIWSVIGPLFRRNA